MATNLANKAAREALLMDLSTETPLSIYLRQVTGKGLKTLLRSWAPFKAVYGEDLVMKLDMPDPGVRQILQDQGLYDQIYNIAIDAFMEAMEMPQTRFIAALILDLLSGEESYYGDLVE